MGVQNIYHTVVRGETVYHISKMYGVDIETIKRVNNITNVRDLKVGQRLLITRTYPMQEAITLYPSDKWQYIIIHHSATDKGNCQLFDAAHKKRGWTCVGYDFVIDNGTSGKANGQIETSPRWIKQEDGAHCKADNMNQRGIGICLVGNFSTGKISNKQLTSLIYLVEKLKNYYQIPSSRVLGHGQVKGASTECPGRWFPWKQFRASLK
jgi:LysM repeat protein